MNGDRALVIVLQSRHFLRLRNAFKTSVFEASKQVATKLNPIITNKALLPPSRDQCSYQALHGVGKTGT